MAQETVKAQEAVENLTQEVKDVKLENGAAPGAGAANGTSPKSDDNVVPFKVTTAVFFWVIYSTICNKKWRWLLSRSPIATIEHE